VIALALLLIAQDVPPAEPEVEEVVVTATYGRTTMLFDKGSDGKLRNCRIMVSSGSSKRDTAACQATPVCYAKTADQVTDCVQLASVEPRAAGPLPSSKPPVFEIPKLVQPKPAPNTSAAGPSMAGEESRTTEAQRVKLPPLPKAPSGAPAITFSVGGSN
jgi:hypothetical protein